MPNFNPVEILRFGVIGLGFLLALMAYRLLSQSIQQKTANTTNYWAVGGFMVFSLVLCAIGLFSQFQGFSTAAGGIGGTPVSARSAMPNLRINMKRTNLSQPECVDRGKKALDQSTFRDSEKNEHTAWGYDRGYLVVVWCPAGEGIAVFAVVGEDFDAVDTKTTNLSRTF